VRAHPPSYLAEHLLPRRRPKPGVPQTSAPAQIAHSSTAARDVGEGELRILLIALGSEWVRCLSDSIHG